MFMKKKTIAVLFGGASTEHEVSLVSATTIIRNLDHDKYQVEMVGITKSGRFLHYTGDIAKIKTGEWEQDAVQDCTFSCNQAQKGLLLLQDGAYTLLPVDCVIPVLHGKNGEDGTVQGLLQLAGIPYVGCDAISSANCMDKEMTHIILEHAGIQMAKWMAVRADEEREETYIALEETLGYPMFVKPANAGSSIGVSKARNRDELKEALAVGFHEDKKVIVEETIIGQEVECAVLGNLDAKPSIPGEIASANAEVYDYESKYVNPQSLLYIPARISEPVMETLRQEAVKAYHAIGCEGLSRVDFFVTADGKILLNEINTFPGFTSISMYPKLWEHTGIPIQELIEKLIDYAFAR